MEMVSVPSVGGEGRLSGKFYGRNYTVLYNSSNEKQICLYTPHENINKNGGLSPVILRLCTRCK